MWLGQRSARLWPGTRGQLILLAGCALSLPALAQRVATVTAGPARIVCNAAFCELGSGARPKERFRVIVSNLPAEEIRRLRKCTGVAQPCIVSVEGIEHGDQMKIMASAIHWQD